VQVLVRVIKGWRVNRRVNRRVNKRVNKRVSRGFKERQIKCNVMQMQTLQFALITRMLYVLVYYTSVANCELINLV
jgi:hypothetical protein